MIEIKSVVHAKKLTKTAKLPEKGSDFAAGYDLFADLKERMIISAHTTLIVGTGLSIAIPQGFFGGIYARSGLSAKEGLRPANCVGVIDSDYRGEIKVALHNDSEYERAVIPGQRIAQLIIQPYQDVAFIEKEDLEATERGEKGFGSTGM